MDLTDEEELIVADIMDGYDKSYHETRIREALPDNSMQRLSYISGVIHTLRLGVLLNDAPEHIRMEIEKRYEKRADQAIAEIVIEQNNTISARALKRRIGL